MVAALTAGFGGKVLETTQGVVQAVGVGVDGRVDAEAHSFNIRTVSLLSIAFLCRDDTQTAQLA